MAETTPMMQQYHRIKQDHRDAILFFRLGDFYEMFQQDAREASSILNLTLTARNKVPMCGIPYHAAQTYIPRLLKAGKKIAICEQISLPEGGKGIAKRQVVEIITPGTVVDENYLDKGENNFLLSIGRYREWVSLSAIDLSTAEFIATAFPWEERKQRLRKELSRLSPREILIQESLLEEDDQVNRVLDEQKEILINRFPDWSFDLEASEKRLILQFAVSNLKGFGFKTDDPALYSTGILLEYLEDSSKGMLPHIRGIKRYHDHEFLGLDESTQRNLEITANLHDGSSKYSLLEILNHTKTSMGSRKLRAWVLQPLTDREQIENRLEEVDFLYQNQILLSSLRETLKGILDLERLSSRIALDKAHGKDLAAVRNSLQGILLVHSSLTEWNRDFLSREELKWISEIVDLLLKGLADDPSILLSDGSLIRKGFNEELERLRHLKENSKSTLDEYLEEEKERTGISSLKAKYNKIIGYYLEVSKANLHLVPEHFIRRQSLVGGERFTTERLSSLESDLNNASEKALEMEKDLFLKLRDQVKEQVSSLLSLADKLARLDCLGSFAYAATIHGYTRPKLSEKQTLNIREGRHPVVEHHLPPGNFVPNSLKLDPKKTTFALITGPNMAGKSTYLRQVALIVLMAQIGSYIPAREAEIGIVDNIFCRVGASDNLARGESTFLVEMNETANIIRSATKKSLVIMDEVGRGTSTNDGLSIAWAVSEHLLETLQCKTLFATHYHELTLLKHEKLKNLSLEVLENEGEIVFLKKIKEGPAGNSYGLHAAKIAGLPLEIVRRATRILNNLKEKEDGYPEIPPAEEGNGQKDLFSPSEIVSQEVRSLNVNEMTPLEALNTIARWQDELIQ